MKFTSRQGRGSGEKSPSCKLCTTKPTTQRKSVAALSGEWLPLSMVLIGLLVGGIAASNPSSDGLQVSEILWSSVSKSGYRHSLIESRDVVFSGPNSGIVLRCEVPEAAQVLRKTVWLLGDEVITYSSSIAGEVDFPSSRQASVRRQRSSTLLLRHVYYNASGVYTCYQVCQDQAGQWFVSMAQQRVAVIHPSVYDTEHFQANSPRIVHAHGPLTAALGSTVSYQCHVERSPDMMPFWHHSVHKTVRNTPGSRLSSDPGFGLLTINSVQHEDTGTITCETQSRYGRHFTTFQLNVAAASGTDDIFGNARVGIHGPNILRRGLSANYVCYSTGVNSSLVSFSWTWPAEFNVTHLNASAVHVMNINAEVESDTQVSCTMSNTATTEAVAQAHIFIRSRPSALPMPASLRFNSRRNFLRVLPPKRISPADERRVIGLCIRVESRGWSWNRTFFAQYRNLLKKIFFSEMVYERIEVMKRFFNKTLSIESAFVDSAGSGHWLTSQVIVNAAPPLPSNFVASLVPGNASSIRLQWDYPGTANNSFRIGERSPKMLVKVKWNNLLAHGEMFQAWHRPVSRKNIDVAKQRYFTIHNLPRGGVLRFKVWVSEQNKSGAKFPIQARNLILLPTISDDTQDWNVIFTLKGEIPCSLRQALRRVTVQIVSALMQQVNPLCKECVIRTRTGARDQTWASETCKTDGPIPTAEYFVHSHTTLKSFSGRAVCDLLEEMQDNMARDHRHSQVHIPSIGLFQITRACFTLGTSLNPGYVCLQKNSTPLQSWQIRIYGSASCPDRAY